MNQSLDQAGGAAPRDERRSGRIFSLILFVTLAASVVSTIYAVSHWWLPPLASVEGMQIDRLLVIFFVLIGVVFVAVHLAMVVFVARFSDRGDGSRASNWHENNKLELSWTVIPFVILAGLTIISGATWVSLAHQPAAAAAGDGLALEVTGHQFGWTFRFAGPDGEFGTTAKQFVSSDNLLGIDPDDPAGKDDVVAEGEIYLPAGVTVHAWMTSTDVIHSFFVPQFRLKQDTVPGRWVYERFTPTQTGTYEIACAELCGVGHYVMRGQIVVTDQAGFDAWLAEKTAEMQAEAAGK